jgi:hypothetical protein
MRLVETCKRARPGLVTVLCAIALSTGCANSTPGRGVPAGDSPEEETYEVQTTNPPETIRAEPRPSRST